MQELYRYEMTDRDLLEMFGAIARCRGSRTRRQLLRAFFRSGVIYAGLYAACISLIWQAIADDPVQRLVYILMVPAAAPFVWMIRLNSYTHAQLRQTRAQKKAAGLDPDAPELHSIRLEGRNYVRCVGDRASAAVPLASLHTAKPVKNGGVVLLFNTGADDYLPARLFSPAYTARDFCLWITGQAAEARKTPLSLEDAVARTAGQEPDSGRTVQNAEACSYCLHYTLDIQKISRLLSTGSRRLYRTAGYWKQQLPGFCILAAIFFVVALIGGVGPLSALCGSLIFSGGFLLLGFIITLLRTNRSTYKMRLGTGAADTLVGPQQMEFYEDHITVRQPAGEYEQSYTLYTQLLDTPDAWFLVSQGAAALLPLPKEGLPECQHADFAAFVREKLAAARVQQGHGPAKKF